MSKKFIKRKIRALKALLRPSRDLLAAGLGFAHDYWRFIRFAGWKADNRDSAERNYRMVRVYHRLEKSLAFPVRKKGSGVDAVKDLVELIEHLPPDVPVGFQDEVALSVLDEFLCESEQDVEEFSEAATTLAKARERLAMSRTKRGGVLKTRAFELEAGVLENPERFFHSRHSIRNFSTRLVPQDLVERAIMLARSTPSVCNRQAWHVYHADERDKIDTALKFQNGNRGFGHTIPCLLVICTDLRAFEPGSERYQHWIDGGMFAMALVLAFHSLGIGTCCLNWSKLPSDDTKLRRAISIEPCHTIVTMMAVGYPQDELKLCASARRPLGEIYTKL